MPWQRNARLLLYSVGVGGNWRDPAAKVDDGCGRESLWVLPRSRRTGPRRRAEEYVQVPLSDTVGFPQGVSQKRVHCHGCWPLSATCRIVHCGRFSFGLVPSNFPRLAPLFCSSFSSLVLSLPRGDPMLLWSLCRVLTGRAISRNNGPPPAPSQDTPLRYQSGDGRRRTYSTYRRA